MMKGGVYCLCISVEEQMQIRIGALGELTFPRGKYVYIGSALNGLRPRVFRHINNSLGKGSVTHWHIDYLLRDPKVNVMTVYQKYTEEKEECKLAESVSQHGDPIPDFGCGDCRCVSHLFKVQHFNFLLGIALDQINIPEILKFEAA
jgi:Uri superfamily endonuclease